MYAKMDMRGPTNDADEVLIKQFKSSTGIAIKPCTVVMSEKADLEKVENKKPVPMTSMNLLLNATKKRKPHVPNGKQENPKRRKLPWETIDESQQATIEVEKSFTITCPAVNYDVVKNAVSLFRKAQKACKTNVNYKIDTYSNTKQNTTKIPVYKTSRRGTICSTDVLKILSSRDPCSQLQYDQCSKSVS